MKPNRLSTKKHTLRFAVILSALVLTGCASTQSTTSSTSASSASSTVSTVSTSEESGADETDSTGGAMNGTIGSVIEANLSFKNKDFYIDYSTEDTVKIDLSAPKKADGVKVSGSTVTITEAGTYVLSGTLTDGQVIIDAGDEDDVRLVLENASITCTTTAPLYAKNADKVIISLPENTESSVTDTITGTDGNDELTAAIFAKCDLSVNGTGTLNVNANANDGITSEDKLKITGGVLNITSADDGLVGKDAVLIKDGTVHITASGNGIKSTKSEADQGYVYIGGGTVNITAEQDGIQAETSVLISAGEVNVTAGGGANGEQKTGNAMFGGAQSTTTDETLSTKGIKAEAALDITGGTVTVDGKELSAMRDEELTIFRRRKIGFVFQNYNLVPVLNVYENIVLPIQLDGKAPDKGYVDQIIETLGLGSKLQNLPNNLSGGQQQRVAIARALAAKPAIILADEPTGNLDSATSLDVMGLLKVTAQKFSQTIVMITHNEELAQMADRIIRIEDGRIVVRG